MKKLFLCILFFSSSIFACTSSLTLPHQALRFFKHPLGYFTVYFSPTLTAIENNSAKPGFPYYQKPWGTCPAGTMSGDCTEYTVYPNGTNFNPNLMKAIKKYTGGKRNRGMVRILTNADQSEYVYTTDHEHDFCGPYPLP